jgi:hypothetical protein
MSKGTIDKRTTRLPSSSESLSGHPNFQNIDAYGRQAAWVGPRYRAGSRVVMLVASGGLDLIANALAGGPAPDAPTLVVPLEVEQDESAGSACIVACYRWLLAQLIVPGDITIRAQEDLAPVMLRAIEQLRNSGDGLPAPSS